MLSFIAHRRPSDGAEQRLESHLRGVAWRNRRYAGKLGLTRLGELIGLLHDLGKYSFSFQTYLRSATGLLNADEDDDWVDATALKGKIDHSSAGAQYIWQFLSDVAKNDPVMRLVRQMAALCIASHHSGLIDCLDGEGEDVFTRRMEKPDMHTHCAEAMRSADQRIVRRAQRLMRDPRLRSEVETLLGQLHPHRQAQQKGLIARFVFSALLAADRIDSANFEHPLAACARPDGRYAGWPLLIDRLESHLAGLPSIRPVDGFRREIADQCRDAATRKRGIYTLEVPTGGGKTLASLRFGLQHAHHHGLDRIIYVIPYTAIIDQNAGVARDVLDPQAAQNKLPGKIVLEHHGNLLPERQTWREKMLSDDWDAPVVFTTMVQFLEALFGSGTRGARRMHQLARAVIIFDEIQTLPVRCVHLFNTAVNFLVEQAGSTAVLCTATQPLLNQVSEVHGALRMADDSELMRNVQQHFSNLKRIRLVNHAADGQQWTALKMSGLVVHEFERAGSCLCIVNTKASARQIFKFSQHAGVPEDAIFHLSTSMCPAHRLDRLSLMIERMRQKLPVLCVSTQLIEAGVDISFAAVVRALAGLDSIAQAAGRCNRHGESECGIVHVVALAGERLGALPEIELGQQVTLNVLGQFVKTPSKFNDDPLGPKLMKLYYEHYFFARRDDMPYPVKLDTGSQVTQIELLSANVQAVQAFKDRTRQAPAFPMRQSFRTSARLFRAIDSETEAVVVPYGEEGPVIISELLSAKFDPGRDWQLLRRAQRVSVNVFPNVLRKLTGKGIRTVHPDLRLHYLDVEFYSDHFGLATEEVTKSPNLIR